MERGKLKRPQVEMKNPEDNDFDEISFNSDDEDFEHEYIEIKNNECHIDFNTEDNNSQFAHLKELGSTFNTPSLKQSGIPIE